jgi:hypothetical protein
MEQTGILNQGGGKIEYVDPSKITAGQKYRTGLVFIYPATANAIDDVDALFTGWIVFNENVNRWQEAGQEALKGNWDASSGTLPSTNIIAGDKYIISIAGTVNGIQLNENDTITAKIDNATDSQTGGIFDDWTVVGAITVTSTNVSRPNGDSVEDSLVDLQNDKVDVVAGKQLSTEDYTTPEKTKLTNIADGAEVNVNADWNSTSGDSQILNKPNFGTGNQDIARGDASYLKNDTYTKPEANALLIVKQDTADKGVAGGYPDLDSNAQVPLSQLPANAKSSKVVADISARNAIASADRFEGLRVHVLNATADTTVDNGSAGYILKSGLANTDWEKTYESENLDIDLSDYFNKTTDTTDDITQGTAKFTTQADIDKLAGIDANATANSTDATLLNRANHTGQQALSTISDAGLLAGKDTIATSDVDNNAINTAKIQQFASKSVVGRTSAGTGDVEEIDIATTLKTDLNLTKSDVGLANADNTSDADKPVSTAAINALKANSAVFVNSLTGDDNNDGLSLFSPFETVGKGLTDVTNSGNVIVLGSDTQSINHTFTSSQNSIKISISDAFKISGTLNLVNGNTSIEFYNGKTNATITDDSAGTFYMNNVNVGGATLNFSRSGYKVIRGSTSTPTVINLTGSGGTLILENVSGGVIPINIGTGWTVYVVNSLLAIGTNNGIVVNESTTLTSVVADQATLNVITGTTNNTLDGLHLINFSSPSITGLTLKKGDIIYKVGQSHSLTYTFESAPDVVSRALSTTTREAYYKNVDEWTTIESKLSKANNLSDVADRQTSLNNLTDVSSANNEYVLTKDTTSGNAEWKPAAGGGSGTNLSIGTTTATTVDINSDTGNNATIPAATTSVAGLLIASDKTKLDATSGTNTGDEVAATESVAGIGEIVTQIEAETGTDNTNKFLNALRNKQAFDAFISAHESQKILSTRIQPNEISYNSDIAVETPISQTSQGSSSITYSSGSYTVSKDCILQISGTISFRNNGSASNDPCTIEVRDASSGIPFGTFVTLAANPSNLVNSQKNLLQSITPVVISLSNGDSIQIYIKGVSLTQFITNAVVTIIEI